MKKFLLSVFIFLIGFGVSHAQTERGNVLIGGNASLNLYKISGQGKYSYNLNLSPKAGFFLVDNLVVGAQLLGYIRNTPLNGNINSQILYGPFGRYYFHNLFLESGIGVNGKDVYLGLGMGYAFFVNNNVAIEPTANVDLANDFAINIMIGFQLYFSVDELRDAF